MSWTALFFYFFKEIILMCCKNVLNKKNQRDIIYKFNQICWFYFNYIIKKIVKILNGLKFFKQKKIGKK